jgi:hypothetical protein
MAAGTTINQGPHLTLAVGESARARRAAERKVEGRPAARAGENPLIKDLSYGAEEVGYSKSGAAA